MIRLTQGDHLFTIRRSDKVGVMYKVLQPILLHEGEYTFTGGTLQVSPSNIRWAIEHGHLEVINYTNIIEADL